MTQLTLCPIPNQWTFFFRLISTFVLLAFLSMLGQESGQPKPVDFETELLPIFKANCLACHSSSKTKGGLNLETPQSILLGADSGDVVLPGNAKESFLYQVTANLVDDTIMPPKDNKSNAHPFTTSELELLQRWIDEGAKGEVLGKETIAWQKMPPGLQAIHATAISPDGTLAVCGRANQIHAYHLKRQQLEARLMDPAFRKSSLYGMNGAAHLDFVQSLAFSPNGQLLASGGYRIIKLWQRTFENNATPYELKSMFGENETWLSVVDSTGTIVIRNLPDLSTSKVFQIPNHQLISAALSPNQQWLLGGSLEGGLFLWRLSDGELIHQDKQTSSAQAMAWIPDHSGVYVAGSDGLIRKWKKTNDPEFAVRLESVWQAHQGDIHLLTLLNEPTPKLVSSGADGVLKYWEPGYGDLLRQVLANNGSLRNGILSGDKKQWATLSDGGSIAILNTETGEQISELKPHPKESQALASAERAKAMAESWLTASQSDLKTLEEASTKAKERLTKSKEALDIAEKDFKDKENAIQDASQKTSKAQQILDQFQEEIRKATKALELAQKNADNAKATALKATNPSDSPSDVEEDDSSTWERLIQKTAETAFAAGQSKEAFDRITANKDEKLQQFQKAIEEAKSQLKKLEGELPPLKMKHSLAKTEWDLATQAEQANTSDMEEVKAIISNREQQLNEATQQLEHQQAQQSPLQSKNWTMSFSADGSILAASGPNGDWRTWNVSNGDPIESGTLQTNTARFIQSAPNNNQWLVAGNNAITTLNTHPTWVMTGTLGNGKPDSPIRDRVNALAFSPDGKWLAAGGGEPSRSGEITLWNLAERTLLKNLDRTHSDTVLGLAFSPDGQRLATAGSDKFAKVIDCRTHEVLLNLEGHTHHVMDVAWKSDGRQLATAGADKVVKIWDFPVGSRKKNLEGYDKQITSASYVGLTDQLIVSSGDTSMRIVNSEGKEIRRFESIPDFQQSTSITPDGNLIATGGDDGSLRIYHADQTKPEVVFEAP